MNFLPVQKLIGNKSWCIGVNGKYNWLVFSSTDCLKESHLVGWNEREREHLGEELSDVLIYLVRLAEQCHVDLPAAVVRKFQLNAAKYPAGEESVAKLRYSKQESS